MYSAILAVLMVTGGPSSPSLEPGSLVADLGSPRFAKREAAEVALGRLGRVAIPALRSVLSNPDPEVRTRAAILLGKIEGSLLVEPTLVNLDYQDVPLSEALASINQQSGLKLTLNPPIVAFWADRKLTIRSPAPLPFWKAVDQICESARLHYTFGGQSDFENGDFAFSLYDGFATSQGRFDDRGPFRVQLASLHYQSEVHLAVAHPFDGNPGRNPQVLDTANPILAAPSKQFFLQVLVGAEPRLTLAPGGPVKVLEAIDDHGQSLVIPSRGEVIHHDSGYLGINSSPLVHTRVDLNYPNGPASRLKRVRGLIPLVVSTRKADPLTIPLVDSANKTFQHNNISVSVGEIKPAQGDQPATIDLSIKVARDASMAEDWDDADLGSTHSIVSPQRLEVLDAEGRAIPWFPSSSFHNGERANITLTFLDIKGAAQPTMIRYHEMIRDRTELPFEFRDLPMP